MGEALNRAQEQQSDTSASESVRTGRGRLTGGRGGGRLPGKSPANRRGSVPVRQKPVTGNKKKASAMSNPEEHLFTRNQEEYVLLLLSHEGVII